VRKRGWKDFTFTGHKFLLVTVKEWLKSVLNYRNYPKHKMGIRFLDHMYIYLIIQHWRVCAFSCHSFWKICKKTSTSESKSGLSGVGQRVQRQYMYCERAHQLLHTWQLLACRLYSSHQWQIFTKVSCAALSAKVSQRRLLCSATAWRNIVVYVLR